MATGRSSWWRLTLPLRMLLIVGILCGSLIHPAPALADDSVIAGDRQLLFGVAGHAWWLDEHLDTFVAAYRDLGTTSIRLSIDWKYIEPSPGSYRWDRYDRVLSRLVDEQFTIVGVFVTIPPWASSNPAGCGIEEREPEDCDLEEQHAAAFENVARAIVTRYPFIRHWEFWNEPELWLRFGADIGNYLVWLKRFYTVVKRVDPDIEVAAATLAGWEYIGWMYDASEPVLGTPDRPWDAVAFHPYNVQGEVDEQGNLRPLRIAAIQRLRQGMIERGDRHKSIWITEYGWQIEAEQQAVAFRQAMAWLQSRTYIAFAHLHMLHDWQFETYGLMRTVPDRFGVGPIDAATRFEPKDPFYSSFRNYRRPEPPAAPPGTSPATTGHLPATVLAASWQSAAAHPGLPLTRPYWERRASGDYALVQVFERARLEWTRTGGIDRGLLGDEALQRAGWLDSAGQPLVAETRPVPPPLGGASLYFGETGHSLGGDFRAAWEAAGGVAALGYPRTEPLRQSLDDGTIQLVQFTQRGRLEQSLSATGAGPVRLARLGSEALIARGWLDAAEQPTALFQNPTRRSYR